jgi:Xaa-Pro aminopeptidase
VATQELPTVTTRYFINGASEKTVLAHREDFCKAADAGDDCARRNVEAAEIDRAAADFLVKTHYAPNATGHMLASSN